MATRLELTRRSLLVGAGATALLAVVGCAPSGTTATVLRQPAGEVPAAFAKRTRIVAWTPWGGLAGEKMIELATRFNDSQDEFYIDAQPQGGYEDLAQKLAASLQAKQTPDIVGLSEILWGKFWLNGTLAPLGDLLGSDILASYDPMLLAEGYKGDKQWWVPFARSTPIFYFNRDLFAQVGLPDRAPATWTEYEEWGKQINGATFNGNKVRLTSYGRNYADWVYMSSVWNRGGIVSDGLTATLDSEIAIEAAEYQRRLIWEKKLAFLTDSEQTDFSNGVISSMNMSTGALGGLIANSPFEVGAGFVPGEGSQEVSTGGGGFSIMAGASEERKAGAAAYLKFLSQPDVAAEWTATTGYLPAVTAASEQPALKDLFSQRPQFRVAVDQLAIAREADPIRLIVPNGQPMMNDALQTIYANNDDPKTVLQATNAAIQKAADGIKSQYDKAMAQ